MRIISGKAKGKKLYSPKGRNIRPTSDRVRESVFNILGDQWKGTRVLDLFSGTGSLGLEAISRGAYQVVFVENSKSALQILKKNASICGFDSQAVILPMSVPSGLSVIGRRGESFHIIFADPPYGKGWVEKTIRHILAYNLLSKDGILVVEHTSREAFLRDHGELSLLRQEAYGEATVSFFGFSEKKKETHAPS